MNGYLNDVVDFFPDRLAEPKWREHCRINGLEHLRTAQQDGRPIVLVFVHFGAFGLIRTWLRSVGIPAAGLLGGRSGNHPQIKRHRDKFFPTRPFPPRFAQTSFGKCWRSRRGQPAVHRGGCRQIGR